jgi:putative ABC transport system permease protein
MIQPPALARLAVRLLVPLQHREHTEGDLLELFHERVAREGVVRARLRYWIDILSVLRHFRGRAAVPASPVPSLQERFMTTFVRATLSELHYAGRGLMKRPGYTALAALTLALGIGSSVAIFAVLNAVVLRPLPYADSDRIVEIIQHAPGLNMPELRSSPGLVARYQQTARSFARIAGYEMRQANLSGSGIAERVRVMAAAPALFDVLATRPALGHAFDGDDARMRAASVVILTDALWRSRFGADPGVVGRAIQLDGRPVEVIGVMPAGFAFPDAETRLIVPFHIGMDVPFGAFGMAAVGRLAPGVSVDAARREIEQLQRRIPEWFPDLTAEVLSGFGWSSSVVPLRDRVVGSVTNTLWLLFGTVGLVLMLAAANVANLFLVRAESRQREVAIKQALGAGRRIVGGFFAESFWLASLAGFAGVLLAGWAVRLLVAFGPRRLPRLHEVRLDWQVALFTIAITVLTAAVLAVLPVAGTARRSFAAALHDGGRGGTAGRGRQRLRQSLVVTQVAMALVLLVGAGLMLRSVSRLFAVNPGFGVDGLLAATMSVGTRTERAQALRAYEQMLDEMRTTPGVRSVGGATTLPIAPTSLNGSDVEVRSRPPTRDAPPLFTMISGITAQYFETLGARLVAGRTPMPVDVAQNRAVAWINQTFARRYLGDRPIGESVKLHDEWFEVVGVVGDLNTSGLAADVQPMVYLPVSSPLVKLDAMHAVVRTNGDPASLAPSLRSAVERIDRTIPVTLRTMQEIIAASLAQTTFTVTLVTIASAIGLVLGIVGLYGAISYITAQRTAEIGVRLALGAPPAGVALMVLRQGATVTAIGIVVGLAAAWSSARFIGSMLFGLSARDPVTYGAVVALLMAVSLLATYVPARRAARIDPVNALRADT